MSKKEEATKELNDTIKNKRGITIKLISNLQIDNRTKMVNRNMTHCRQNLFLFSRKLNIRLSHFNLLDIK